MAAEVKNSMRTKNSDHVWTALDFMPKDEVGDAAPEKTHGGLLPPNHLRREMDIFARAHNRQHQVKH